jgi:hypothetical protein
MKVYIPIYTHNNWKLIISALTGTNTGKGFIVNSVVSTNRLTGELARIKKINPYIANIVIPHIGKLIIFTMEF